MIPSEGVAMKIKYLTNTVALPLILLLATVAAAAQNSQQASMDSPKASTKDSTVIKTYLRADLSLKIVFSDPSWTTDVRSAAFIIKTCRCTCGEVVCQTDADCGSGGVCDSFRIPLCPGAPQCGPGFSQSVLASSRKNPSPLNEAIQCKQ
jgi:hypothetical protein